LQCEGQFYADKKRLRFLVALGVAIILIVLGLGIALVALASEVDGSPTEILMINPRDS